jgi:hypothetical protein
MDFTSELTHPQPRQRSDRNAQMNTRIPIKIKEAIDARSLELGLKSSDWVINAFIQALNNPNEFT